METTPASLLERLRRPEDGAWERFVELYAPLLYYWANHTGMSLDDADDLVQEVFAILLRKLPEFTYDGKKSFRAWLRTVLLNKWRARQRQPKTIALADNSVPDGLAESDGVEEFWESEYRQHLTKRALELIQTQFQPPTWKAFWETVVHDRTASEVAAELDISVNSVYIARSRVLTCLRRELEGLLD